MQSNEGAGTSSRSFLVLTGSSAGGIEPVCTFVEGLPVDFDAPVVVAQHLSPDHTSRLAEIIASRSRLPVVVLEDRTRLEPGRVYVVGPDRDAEIGDGFAIVAPATRRGAKPSIDRLFDSAAPIYGDRLIAIVFSGLGQDGFLGARSVKEHGGTVIIQELASAVFPSMPASIPPTVYDMIARPEAMPRLVVGVLREAQPPDSAAEEQALRSILAQVRDRSGIDFTQYKTPTIMRRMARVMVSQGATSISEYGRQLVNRPQDLSRLARAFLIKVTEFFRDAELFEELRTNVLPQLFEAALERNREVRIWSAGTSTGEEAFSVAMLCDELTRTMDDKIGVRIFATDLDEEAIAFARRGVYSAGSLRNLPQGWIDRYFVRIGEAYEVTKRIRNMTVFGQHDLGQRAPFPRVDLVFCRNVLIYFTKELQTRALQLFAFSLREGGFLVLGKAESTGALAEAFTVDNAVLKIYRRAGERILIPPIRLRELRDSVAEPKAPAPREASGAAAPFGREPRSAGHDLFASFLANVPIGMLVVDRRYDIVGLNAAARALLEIHGVGIGEDVVHLVSGIDAVALRELIDEALAGDAPPAREFAVSRNTGESERWLQIMCVADHGGNVPRGGAVGIFVIDVTTSVRGRAGIERAAHEQQQRSAELQARVDDLSRRQKALLQANDELTTVNGELRSTNEQLLIDVEEAASANEEIETLNEEMQATNEELETLNEELQATVEELNTTNDEIEVRGNELEQIAEARERQLRAVERRHHLMRRALAETGPFVIVEDGNVVELADDAEPILRHHSVAELTSATSVRVDGTTYAVDVRPLGDTGALRIRFRSDDRPG